MRLIFKYGITLLFSMAIGLVVVPLMVYENQFSEGIQLSNSQEIWGQFGDFINVWVSLANLILLAGLTIYIHKRESTFQQAISQQNSAQNRPIIIFKLDTADEIYPQWIIKNIGNGAAFNINFNYVTENKDSYSQFVAKLYSLGSGDQISLPGLTIKRMAASYEDIFGTPITSF